MRIRPHLDIILPDLFDAGGGIARISKATVLACAQWCASNGVQLRVAVLGDRAGRRPEGWFPPGATFRAFGGDRRRLSAWTVASAWTPGHRLTVLGHVNLAVTALAFPRLPLTRSPWGARWAIIAHGIEVWGDLSRARTSALRRATAIWPISRFTADALIGNHGVDSSRITVVPNCLDPDFTLEPLPSDRAFTDPPFVMAVSRLSSDDRYKGIDHTIEALARVDDTGLRLKIVGRGDDRQRLERLAQACGVVERVDFLGFVSDADLNDLYASCLALVLPSKSEGFGLVYVEAMAKGAACIAASAGGAPEVVSDGETGSLVAYGDVDALAAAMTRLVANPTDAEAAGRAGWRRARLRFGFDTYAANVYQAISTIV